MASVHSYKITFSNNLTEKEGIDFVLSRDQLLRLPTKQSRKDILEILELPNSFSRAFDLILLSTNIDGSSEITIESKSEITLVELKTTKKKLPNNPAGFFFGATENEFKLARIMGDQYLFCFVCLHPDSMSFKYMKLSEVEKMIRTQRVQYQINFKS
jgi:hypothetical protein